jgi:hypothetical protein
VPSQKIRTTAIVARIRMMWIREMWTPMKYVTTSGKNSLIDGAWNSPPSSAVWAIRVAA